MIRYATVCVLAMTASVYSAASLASSDNVFVETLESAESTRCVVLLHGLARTSSSMQTLAEALVKKEYRVANVDYPSRHHRVEKLSDMAVSAGLEACRQSSSEQIFVVTHSLGGILVRDYLSREDIPELRRIVMLAPPNHGSEVVDNLKGLPGFHWLNGPAIDQLGTDENSVPLQLGKIFKDTAIIAGTRSINLYLSTFLENPDDGKVSVASTRLAGMCAMLTLPVSHPFIMKDDVAIEQTITYLEKGRFTHEGAEYLVCPANQRESD